MKSDRNAQKKHSIKPFFCWIPIFFQRQMKSEVGITI